MNIGSRFKQARMHAKLTQEDVAAKVGISRSHIIALEKITNGNEDRDSPTLRTFYRLCDFFKLNPAELLAEAQGSINENWKGFEVVRKKQRNGGMT